MTFLLVMTLRTEAGQASLHVLLSAPLDPAPKGSPVTLWLNFLNGSGQAEAVNFPMRLRCNVTSGDAYQGSLEAVLVSKELREINLPPGAFDRRAYELTLPDSIPAGQARLATPDFAATPIAIRVMASAQTALPAVASGSKKTEKANLPESREEPPSQPGPVEFFKEHLFPYDPFYFVAGGDSPNAKFQISFKYQIINQHSQLASDAPAITNLYFGYTQTSLWDWNKPSAPFFDSSYKPELHYSITAVERGRWNDWFKVSLQSGFMHESNGRDGLDSRSLNLAYLKAALIFGRPGHVQFTLAPRAWFFVGSLSDNPYLADYRGYADLRAILGCEDGLQLSGLFRMGQNLNRGSAQLDMTYPLSEFFGRYFSVYLHLQYFTGYGESLLRYDERSSAFRAGFSLYR